MPSTAESAHVPFTEFTLDNGLRLVVNEDHSLPLAAINVWYGVGSHHDRPGRTGLAHLFERLMFQGSAHVAPGEHESIVMAAGGSCVARTSLTRTTYGQVVPSHLTDLVLWLEAERMGGLVEGTTKDAFEAERTVVKNERLTKHDNAPYGTAHERLLQLIFPATHPYNHPIIGSIDDIEAATLDDVKAFFRAYYVPKNAVIAVVGDVDASEIRESVERYFGAIKADPSLQQEPVPDAPDGRLEYSLGGEKRQVVHDRVAAPQIFIGFRAPPYGTPEFEAINVATRLLSGGPAARLGRAMQIDEQLAVSVRLGHSHAVGDIGVASGAVVPRPGVDLDEVESKYYEVIEGLITDPATDEELARARARFELLHHNELESFAVRADELARGALYFDDANWINGTLDRFNAVTAEQISETAAQIFRPENRGVVTYLPEESG